MTDADRISTWADVPHELAELVVMSALRADLPVRLLRSDDRHQHLVEIRRQVAIEARSLGYSFPVIGRAMNRDHSSVMHYFKREALR